jgi:hypothetical protein
MREPEPIPIHEIPAEPGAASSEAGASATERGIDFLAGVVSFGAGLVVSALDGEQDDDRSAGLAAFVAAGAGLFLEGLRAAAPVLGSIERTAGPTIGSSGAADSIGELLDHWRESWEDRHEDDRQRDAEDQLRAAFQRSVDTLLDQLDLTSLVLDHVDIQRIASTLDLAPLLATLDVDALAARLDMNRMLDRIDMDRLLDRIDMERLTARIDVEALLDRVDLPAVASDVIDDLDIPQVIREATADTASEGVRDVRLRGVEADQAIRRAVDRLLSRSNGDDR